LIPARYKPLEEMVPAPVATLEEVLDKIDEETAIIPEEDLKIDMSVDEDETDIDTDVPDVDDAADDPTP
jgi:hypothetical protein